MVCALETHLVRRLSLEREFIVARRALEAAVANLSAAKARYEARRRRQDDADRALDAAAADLDAAKARFDACRDRRLDEDHALDAAAVGLNAAEAAVDEHLNVVLDLGYALKGSGHCSESPGEEETKKFTPSITPGGRSQKPQASSICHNISNEDAGGFGSDFDFIDHIFMVLGEDEIANFINPSHADREYGELYWRKLIVEGGYLPALLELAEQKRFLSEVHSEHGPDDGDWLEDHARMLSADADECAGTPDENPRERDCWAGWPAAHPHPDERCASEGPRCGAMTIFLVEPDAVVAEVA